MLGVTLGEVLGTSRLGKVSVLAGHSGLSRPISGVQYVRNPVAEENLPHSTLVGVDERIFAGNIEYFAWFLRYCARNRCAGVAVAPQPASLASQEAVLAVADRQGLPLIRIAYGKDILEWLLLAGNEILAVSSNKISHVRRFEYRLRDLTLSAAGVEAICSLTCKHLRRPVLIASNERRILAANWPESTPGSSEMESRFKLAVREALLIDEVEESILSRLPGRSNCSERPRVYHKTILADGRSFGSIRVFEVEQPFQEADVLCIDQAAAAVAVELSKQSTVYAERMRLQGDLLAHLVEGNLSEGSFRSLVRAVGWDCKPGFAVVVIGVQGRNEPGKRPTHDLSLLVEALCRASPVVSRRAMVGTTGDSVTTILSCLKDKGDLEAQLDSLKRSCATWRTAVPVSLGTSDIFNDIGAVSERYIEAMQALEIGSRLFGPGEVYRLGDIGAHRLLTRMTAQELRSLISYELGPLGMDDDYASELRDTLLAYFRCDGSIASTARLCSLHPSTVKYRLSKVWSGRKPSFDKRARVYMALLADSLLRKGLTVR